MSRTRQRVETHIVSPLVWKDAGGSTIQSNNYNEEWVHRILVDNPASNFRERIAAGEIIINDFDMVLSKIKVTKNKIDYSRPGNNDYQFGFGPIVQHYDGVRSYNAALATRNADDLASVSRDLAVINAHANIQNPDIMGLVTLAELDKTAALLISPIKGIRKRVNRLSKDMERIRKRNQKAFDNYQRTGRYRLPDGPSSSRQVADYKRFIKDMAKAWLTWRYGVRPLIAEVQGLLKHMDRELTDIGRARSRGYGIQFASADGTLTGGDYQANTTWSIDTKVESWAGVIFDFGLGRGWQRAQLLGLTDIPSTAWEITRFSFMFDWIVNVGSWLRAVTPTLGVSNRNCWVTTTTTTTINVQVNSVNGSSGGFDFYTLHGSHKCKYETVRKQREHGEVPILPPVNLRIDTQKVLDVVALLVTDAFGMRNLRL